MASTAARAASALSKGSFTSCSSVADMTVYLTTRTLGDAHPEGTAEQRRRPDVLAENQHFKRAAEAAGHDERLHRQARFQVAPVERGGAKAQQKVGLIKKSERDCPFAFRRHLDAREVHVCRDVLLA